MVEMLPTIESGSLGLAGLDPGLVRLDGAYLEKVVFHLMGVESENLTIWKCLVPRDVQASIKSRLVREVGDVMIGRFEAQRRSRRPVKCGSVGTFLEKLRQPLPVSGMDSHRDRCTRRLGHEAASGGIRRLRLRWGLDPQRLTSRWTTGSC